MRRREFTFGAGALGMAGAFGPGAAEAADPTPYQGQGRFQLVKDWTFGRSAPGTTVRNMADLRKSFFFRYIYNSGKLDRLDHEWSRHADYPENDPRSLHVFQPDALVLKARIPPGGGLRPGGIESGILRAKLPVTPGMYVEMRAKLPRGLGVWPAFWLNPGVESDDGHFSALPWPPEIDIFEFFVWQGRDRPRIMESHIQENGDPHKFGDPHDLFTTYKDGKLDTGVDYSADYHTFALDWVKDKPIWVVDGRKVKQTYYEWPAPPAHILVSNQIGMTLQGVDLTGMQANTDDWDYSVQYLRVWQRI
ncbi:MAG: family 16 glycosylhydrolase [Caulobacteraceae bacterium]